MMSFTSIVLKGVRYLHGHKKYFHVINEYTDTFCVHEYTYTFTFSTSTFITYPNLLTLFFLNSDGFDLAVVNYVNKHTDTYTQIFQYRI